MMDDEKWKKGKSNLSMVLFLRKNALSFLILAHVLRHNNKTPTYKQCLLLLNKSRPSPASRSPRFRYVLLLLLYFLIFILLVLRDEEEDGDGRWWILRRKCLTFLLTRARSWDAPNVHETLRIWTRGHTCTLFFFMCAFYRELYASCILSLRVCIFRRR